MTDIRPIKWAGSMSRAGSRPLLGLLARSGARRWWNDEGLVKPLHAVVSHCTVHNTLREPPTVDIKIDIEPGATLDYATDAL
jgi:hypothetical protein